jgi:hypothetical protein
MSRLELTEAVIGVVAGLLVAAGCLIGGFPDPHGAGGSMFVAGIVLAGVPAIRRLVSAAAGRRPYRRT